MNTEHIITIIDGGEAGDTPLDFARRSVEHGGRATLVVLLSDRDHRNIEAFAASERMDGGTAEKLYIEATTAALVSQVGADRTDAIVGVRSHEQWDLADLVLSDTSASTVVIPRRLARRSPWRAVADRSQVPVVITPPRAA